MIQFQTDTTELMDSIRRNLNALEEYKRYPLELAQRAQSMDRYLVEIA